MNNKLEIEENDIQNNLNKNFNAEIIEKKHHSFANTIIILLILLVGGGLAFIIYFDMDPIAMLGLKKVESAIVDDDKLNESTTSSKNNNIKPNIKINDNQTKKEITISLNNSNYFITLIETAGSVNTYVELYINNENFMKFDNAYKDYSRNIIKSIKGIDKEDYLFISIPSVKNGVGIEKPIIINKDLDIIYNFQEFNFNGNYMFIPDDYQNEFNYVIKDSQVVFYSPINEVQKYTETSIGYAKENILTISNNKIQITTDNDSIKKGKFSIS